MRHLFTPRSDMARVTVAAPKFLAWVSTRQCIEERKRLQMSYLKVLRTKLCLIADMMPPIRWEKVMGSVAVPVVAIHASLRGVAYEVVSDAAVSSVLKYIARWVGNMSLICLQAKSQDKAEGLTKIGSESLIKEKQSLTDVSPATTESVRGSDSEESAGTADAEDVPGYLEEFRSVLVSHFWNVALMNLPQIYFPNVLLGDWLKVLFPLLSVLAGILSMWMLHRGFRAWALSRCWCFTLTVQVAKTSIVNCSL